MTRGSLRRVLAVAGIAGLLTMLAVGDAIPVNAAISVTINGRAVYEESDGSRVGISGATVRACDLDGFSITGTGDCTTRTSAADGTFTLNLFDFFEDPLEDDNDLEVYVEIEANSDGVRINHEVLPTSPSYCYRSRSRDVDDGGVLDFGDLHPRNSNSCGFFSAPLPDDETENAAFYVFTELQHAWEYMSDITLAINHKSVPKVSAVLAPTFELVDIAASFSLPPGFILYQPNAWEVGSIRGRQTLFHEYGHHLMSSFAENPLPNYLNGVCDQLDLSLTQGPPELGHCAWTPELGVAAWTEGVPTFIAVALETEIYSTTTLASLDSFWIYGARRYATVGPELPAMLETSATSTQNTVLYTSTSTGFSFVPANRGIAEVHPDDDYQHIEGWTTATLWDLYDNLNDDHNLDGIGDSVSISFRDIWTVISTYDPEPDNFLRTNAVTLLEFYDGVLDQLSDKVSQAALTRLYRENHIDVPMTELTLISSATNYDWNPLVYYGRDDVMAIDFTVCLPPSADVPWGGEAQMGASLFPLGRDTSVETFPPMTIPPTSQVGQNACATGTYEFKIPPDMDLPPTSYLSGSFANVWNEFEVVLCADPDDLLAEVHENNNCGPRHTLRLQNKPPVLVTNAPGRGYRVDEGGDISVNLTGTTDPDARTDETLEYRVFGAGGDIDTGFVSSPSFTFKSEDIPFLADGGNPSSIDFLQVEARDTGPSHLASTGAKTIPLTVGNMAPITWLTNTPRTGWSVVQGNTLTIQGQFIDPAMEQFGVVAHFSGESDPTVGMITGVEVDPCPTAHGYVGYYEITRTFASHIGTSDLEFHVTVTDDDGGSGNTPNAPIQVLEDARYAVNSTPDPVSAVACFDDLISYVDHTRIQSDRVVDADTALERGRELERLLVNLRRSPPGPDGSFENRDFAIAEITQLLAQPTGAITRDDLPYTRAALDVMEVNSRYAPAEPADTHPGHNVIVSPGNGVTVRFERVISVGTTRVQTMPGPAWVDKSARGRLHVMYDITTTAGRDMGQSLEVAIEYQEADFTDESSLRLLHMIEGEWSDITANLDLWNNVISGTVSSLSSFMIVQGTIDGVVSSTARYESAETPLSIHYPANWTVNPFARVFGVTAQFEGDNFEGLTITEEDALQLLDLQSLLEYTQATLDMMSATLADFHLRQMNILRNFEGREVAIVEYTAFLGYPVRAQRLIYVDDNGYAFNATFWAADDDFDELRPTIDRSFATFSTGKKPPPTATPVPSATPIPTAKPTSTPEPLVRPIAVPTASPPPIATRAPNATVAVTPISAPSPIPTPTVGSGRDTTSTPAPTPSDVAPRGSSGTCNNPGGSNGGADLAMIGLLALPSLLLTRRWKR